MENIKYSGKDDYDIWKGETLFSPLINRNFVTLNSWQSFSLLSYTELK